MKISVIISACDNRTHLFERSLDTWATQTMPKKDFEIIIVDDSDRESLRQLCYNKSISDGLNIRFVKIDKSKSVMPVKSFIPVLTNNVGFRLSKGDVVVVTGPETLQSSGNLEIAWSVKDKMECFYGLVFRANVACTDYIAKGWGRLKNLPMSHLLQIPGAKHECVTKPPHPPAYWYFMCVAKRHIENIGGVDERFLGGLCGEDDDFSNRMRLSGVIPRFEHGILGIHQDHSREDFNDNIHIDRRKDLGYNLWVHNYILLQDNIRNGIMVANEGHDWGSSDLITFDEYYGDNK